MSDMTEYELHTQGACHCLTPAYDGRDPMRNRPHSNGTDTTMPITRYGLGREYAGNTGSPAITEQADGAYVRYEDFQRMEAGYKNHNDLMVLRTKKAESALDSENAVPVAYYYQYEDGWTAQCRFEGPGPLAVKPLYTAPVAAQPSVPELTSTIVNEAAWRFVEAMPHNLPGPIFNDLKPALYAAICHVLTTPPADGQVHQDKPCDHSDHVRPADGVCIECGEVAQQDADKVDAQPSDYGRVGEMTPQRAAYFLERFKRDEKLLGPNEQRALEYSIALLQAQTAPSMAVDVSTKNMPAHIVQSMDDATDDLTADPEFLRGLTGHRNALVRGLAKALVNRQRVQPASGEDKE